MTHRQAGMQHHRFMTNIGIAYYSPEEYAKLLLTADDASELEDTWEEWYQNMQKTRNNLAALGILCSEVPIQIEALQKYCQEHNLKNNGAARSEYVATLLQQQQQSQQKKITLKKRRKRF
jgi:hypothetical protein